MKLAYLTVLILLMASAVPALLVGCTSQQKPSLHVSNTEYTRYVKKYPGMGEAVKNGRLSRDAAYSLRNIAPQMVVQDQFFADVEAERAKINARHISEAEKRRLIREYMHRISKKYQDAANAAGRQAEQSSGTP